MKLSSQEYQVRDVSADRATVLLLTAAVATAGLAAAATAAQYIVNASFGSRRPHVEHDAMLNASQCGNALTGRAQ